MKTVARQKRAKGATTAPSEFNGAAGDRIGKNAPASSLSERILTQARTSLFSYGYSAFTMDDLASELGLSKKTLYVHFPSKDAILVAVLDQFAAGVRSEAEALLENETMKFAEKLRAFATGLIARLRQVTPAVLRDLQRFAPQLHAHVEELRSKNIPYIFGRFVETGQKEGAVRADIDPVFAGEYYLHAMQGLMQPATLQRLGIGPELMLERALRLFFGGLLTPAGQRDYEKLFPR